MNNTRIAVSVALHFGVFQLGRMSLTDQQRSEVETTPPPALLRERNYILVLLNSLLAYVSNQLIIPVIPLYLVAQGHTESFVGLVISAFNITSFSSRPLFGRWVDAGHPKAALATSSVLLAAASYAYLIPHMIVLFLVRGVHGLGWAGLNTVASAWVAHLAPPNRRAEAVGYYTVTQSSGIAFAPVAGIWLYYAFGFTTTFVVAGVFAVAATITILQAAARPVERVPATEPGGADAAGGTTQEEPRPWWGRIVEPSALLGTMILAAMQVNVPAFSSYVPLYFLSIQMSHVEIFFLATGVSSMLGRGSLGRWADRMGRMRSITLGALIQIVGLVLMGQAQDLLGLSLGGVILTLGQSVSHPSLYALVIDRSPAHRRGAALATYTMGFQLGSGVGAVIYGFVIEIFGYRTMYSLSTLPVFLALGITLWSWWRSSRQSPAAVGPA